MPDREAAELLGNVIDRWRISQGWSPMANDDHDRVLCVWFEILSHAGVPPRAYASCYNSAMARRAELKAQGRELQHLTADDLVVEWLKIRGRPEDSGGVRLLPEHAGGACQRCFGTGKEEMPDGSVREGCRHLPFTERELEERARAKAAAIRILREANAKISAIKSAAPPRGPSEPAGEPLQCSACGRKVNTSAGWAVNETCGMLLARGEVCGGRMTQAVGDYVQREGAREGDR